MKNLKKAINLFFSDSLKLQEKETVLVIADELTNKIGKTIYNSVLENNIQAFYLELSSYGVSYKKMPKIIAGAIRSAKIIISLTGKVNTICQKAVQKGARVACLAGLTRDELKKAFLVDYDFVGKTSRKFADIFTIGKEVKVTSLSGTNIKFTITRRKGFANSGLIDQPGEYSEFPVGKAYVAPVEGICEGMLFIDGSIQDVGLIKEPVKMIVKNGIVTRIYGGEEAKIFSKIIKSMGVTGRNISEFGMGTNNNGRLTGNLKGDEKILGTAHIAFGENKSFGGKFDLPFHFNAVFRNPTVTIDGKTILYRGKLMI